MHISQNWGSLSKGLAELARTLRPDGKAYVMVPFIMERNETFEYGAPDPFMFDHVREFSPRDFDLSPFEFKKITRHDFLTPQEIRQYRIPEKKRYYSAAAARSRAAPETRRRAALHERRFSVLPRAR